jgi:glycosyltransferase involved in cell wall biosynthesis
VIVYLALGGRRIQAAIRYAESVAAPVTLVVAGQPDLVAPPGVVVHRFAPGQERAVRRFLLAADGPLRDADLLIAGDPEATPVTWAVARHRPGLAVAFEPSPDPARRPAEAGLAVVTPWYPAPDDPFAGAFVQACTNAVGDDFDRVAVLHTQSWFYSPRGVRGQIVGVAAERQAARSGNAVVLDTPEGELTRVAVPTASGDTYPQYAEAQVNALRAALPTGRIEAPLVHAHTGMLGGVVATRLARPDARIVVTEHATFLPTVFAQPGARRQYGEMLARVDALLCVSRSLHDQLGAYFPEHAGKLRVVPNAIDFDRFAVRATPPAEPLRWLYVGRLMEHKGVLTLLDGFARIAAEDPRVTLTLVGAGVLEETVAERAATLGLGDRVTLRPPVPPDQVTALMHEHDLLVHASRRETFGMTVIEAIATGTPVLVARSQGPAETLAGLEDSAGQSFEPTEDPDVLAAAYRALRARFGALDLPGARAELLGRYGSAAVAARLREVYSEPRGERGPALRPPSSRSPLGQRLAARLSDPTPEAILRRLHRIGRRLVRPVRS